MESTSFSATNFSIKWKEHQSNLNSSLQDILLKKEFLDVTLCCGNSHDKVLAHKIVLAAGSTLFRQILSDCSKEAIVYLKGINKADLELIILFLYNGSVDVPVNYLNNFLAAAEDLEVTGLVTALDSKQEMAPLDSPFSPKNYKEKQTITNYPESSFVPANDKTVHETNIPSLEDREREDYSTNADNDLVSDLNKINPQNKYRESVKAHIIKLGVQAKTKNNLQAKKCHMKNKIEKTKVGKYKRNFREEWLTMLEFQPWLQRCLDSSEKAYCLYCDMTILAKINTIKHHANALKHKKKKLDNLMCERI